MTRRGQIIAGVLWALFGAGMMLRDIIQQASDRFQLSGAYYAIAWGVFTAGIVGGILMALGRALGRWLTIGSATLVAINELWVVLAYGAESTAHWVAQTIAVIVFAFAVTVVASKQPNSTLHRTRA
jgi:hypothetical protein